MGEYCSRTHSIHLQMHFMLHKLIEKKALSRSNYNLIKFHPTKQDCVLIIFVSNVWAETSFQWGVGEFFSKVYKTCSETCLALSTIIAQKISPVWLSEENFNVPSWSKSCSGGISTQTRSALCGISFFQTLCQLECVHVVLKLCGQCWLFCWKPKLFQSHRQSHSRWMGSRVEERVNGGGEGGYRGLNASPHHGPLLWRKGWLIGA